MTRAHPMLIDGKWESGTETISVIDKYTGEEIGTVPRAGKVDVERAVDAACGAFAAYAHLPAHARARILSRVSQFLEENREEIATLICREAGKAWRFSLGEVGRAVETFQFAAEEAKRIHGETVPMDASKGGENRIGFYLRTPVGAIAAISPFNFPLNLVAHKVAPALAAGNTVVLKPATSTPLTAVRLAEILVEAGVPEGAFNLVFGPGATVGDWLVTDKRIGKVTFTGSPPVGARIVSRAGIKKVTLELGNNSGTIIEADADIDKAVPRSVVSAFANSGQVCISLQRLYLHEKIAGEFTERFLEASKGLKVGNPVEKDCDVGPMIDEAEAERAEQWIKEAVSGGAKILTLTGGKREGRLLWPTVLSNVQPDMKVMCREVFAPVVSLVTYGALDDALEMMADTEYGLQAGIYTKDIEKAFRALRRLDVGGLMVNDTSIFRVDQMPYGGNKLSGIGREGLRYAVEEMTNIRMVCFNLS